MAAWLRWGSPRARPHAVGAAPSHHCGTRLLRGGAGTTHLAHPQRPIPPAPAVSRVPRGLRDRYRLSARQARRHRPPRRRTSRYGGDSGADERRQPSRFLDRRGPPQRPGRVSHSFLCGGPVATGHRRSGHRARVHCGHGLVHRDPRRRDRPRGHHDQCAGDRAAAVRGGAGGSGGRQIRGPAWPTQRRQARPLPRRCGCGTDIRPRFQTTPRLRRAMMQESRQRCCSSNVRLHLRHGCRRGLAEPRWSKRTAIALGTTNGVTAHEGNCTSSNLRAAV